VINADGTGLRWILQDINVGRPSWSVKGIIAFSNGGSIWTIRPDGSGLTRLTATGGDAAPRWSPDGSLLAFVHGVGNANSPAYDIVTTHADGTGRRTVATGGNNIDPSWSPDGLFILFDHPEFNAQSGWVCTLRKVPSTRGTVANLTPDRGAGTCGGSAWRPL
jgi:Tol biopolymer transport system component